MLMPSIFGENLFDDFFGDFPFYDDRDMQNVEKKLYGKHAGRVMKTDMTKTIKFDLKRSEDGTEMSNATVMVFPSSETPPLELLITLKDGSVHKLSRNLNSTLSANTRLTLNIVIGDILSGGSTGDFTIENWNEVSETIEFPMVD